MKICNKCNQEKEMNDFYLSKSCKDKKMKICKLCFNIANFDYNKEYKKTYKKNKEYIKEYNKKWRQKNKGYDKKWYNNNKDKINQYQKNKKLNNTLYKLSANIRTRISQSLSGYSKSKSTLDILGVKNFEYFKQHIESQFIEGMTWDNYGYGKDKWVIDHRIPLVSAKTEQEIYSLNHHSNLQPMWWYENMIKGASLI
jgi:hypothetical protein